MCNWISLLTDVILFKRNFPRCILGNQVFTCAQAGSWTSEIPLPAFRFPLRESSAQDLLGPASSKPDNVDSSAGCGFWKYCTIMERLRENGWSVWKQKICIEMQCCAQNGRRHGGKRNDGVENVPSPTSPRQDRSGLLHGFGVSPPCTFQSHYLHFISL